MTSRLASIQQMRGLAALLVVLVHAFDLVDRLPDEAARSAIARLWLFNDFGASGVDLFFVLSGFVMTLGLSRHRAPGAWRAFLSARASRILPLLWLLTVAFVLLSGSRPDWRSLANTVTLLPLLDARLYSFPPLWIGWTLAFETAFYLLVAVALCTRRPVVCLAGLLAFACAAGWVFKPSLPLLQILLNPIMLEFGYGVLGCLLWQRGIAPPAAILAAIVGLGLLVGPRLLYPEAIFSPEAVHTIDGSLGLTRAILWGAPWALILVGIVAFDRDESDRGQDPLVMVGNASYSLYLTHAILMALLEQWGLIPALWPPLIIVAATCAAIALGLATHWAVERPIARWFAQRGRFQATCVTAEARIAHLPA